MTDAEIRVRRQACQLSCEYLAHHDAIVTLADEALRRGKEIVRLQAWLDRCSIHQAPSDVPRRAPMFYEAFEDKRCAGDWRVEAVNAEGEVYVVIFSGPEACVRAAEYAVWKNNMRRWNEDVADEG